MEPCLPLAGPELAAVQIGLPVVEQLVFDLRVFELLERRILLEREPAVGAVHLPTVLAQGSTDTEQTALELTQSVVGTLVVTLTRRVTHRRRFAARNADSESFATNGDVVRCHVICCHVSRPAQDLALPRFAEPDKRSVSKVQWFQRPSRR